MRNKNHDGFPEVSKAIENFMSDEEGNITRNKILTVGAVAIVLGLLYTSSLEALAAHRSHSSHSSHSSGSYSGHYSHVSHSSHVSSYTGFSYSDSGSNIGTTSTGLGSAATSIGSVTKNQTTASTAQSTSAAIQKTSSTTLPLSGVSTADAVLKSGGKLYPNSNLGKITDGYIQETSGASSPLVMNANNINSIYAMTNFDWSCIYQQAYYIQCNPDVYQAIGNDPDALFQHFVNNGMAEGRIASPEFNVQVYMQYYPDLVKVFGTDLKQYYLHYMNSGKAEGRIAY